MEGDRSGSEHVAKPVDGIVLAAGRSSRMGQPKPLLRVGQESFLERAVRVLRDGGCRRVFVVAHEDDAGVIELAESAGADVVRNPDAGSEQIDSLRRGLDALPEDSDGAVVLPVDHPLLATSTVEAMILAFRHRNAPIVRATHRGEPGHPTLFARELYPELSRTRLPDGARTVIDAHADEMEDVPVDDPGVPIDINTPEEYRREVEER